MLAVTEKTHSPCSVVFFLCLKSKQVQEEHGFSRGRKFLHLLFSFTPSIFSSELKLSSSKKQLQEDLQNLPYRRARHLVLSSVQMDKRCWICLARLTGLGLLFPVKDSGYETCSQSCPRLQALYSIVLLVSGLQSNLELDMA